MKNRALIWYLFVTFMCRAQLIDRTLAPNPLNEGIAKSLQQEIGAGTGVFGAYLRTAGVDVKCADIDDTRQPDFKADVANLDDSLPAGMQFDVVAAFQVLEHLPFDRLDACLAGIARRTRKFALISLPYHGLHIHFSFSFGPLRLAFGFSIPWPWRKRFDGQHHWELGVGYPVREITRRMAAHFDVVQHRVIPENPYHRLWILEARRPG